MILGAAAVYHSDISVAALVNALREEVNRPLDAVLDFRFMAFLSFSISKVALLILGRKSTKMKKRRFDEIFPRVLIVFPLKAFATKKKKNLRKLYKVRLSFPSSHAAAF